MTGGSFYADDIKRALHIRLKECEVLPELYQDILHTQKAIQQKELLLERERIRAQMLTQLSPESDWSSWEVGLLVGGVGIGAIAIGIVVGAVGITVYR
jgi:hypothetical protein